MQVVVLSILTTVMETGPLQEWLPQALLKVPPSRHQWNLYHSTQRDALKPPVYMSVSHPATICSRPKTESYSSCISSSQHTAWRTVGSWNRCELKRMGNEIHFPLCLIKYTWMPRLLKPVLSGRLPSCLWQPPSEYPPPQFHPNYPSPCPGFGIFLTKFFAEEATHIMSYPFLIQVP